MLINEERANSTRLSAVRGYEEYVEVNGVLTSDSLFSMPVLPLVGYFLKVHSKDPEAAVRRYLKEHSISYRKANEIKALVSILK